MKITPILFLGFFVYPILISIAWLTINVPEANPQQIPQVTNGLFYPTSSQRFFEQGHRQMEIEIERLQNNSASQPVLTISADLVKQQTLLQQQEQWLQRQESVRPTIKQTQGLDAKTYKAGL